MRYVFLILIFASCSPVSRVIKNPNRLNEVRQYLVDQGMCVSDTVTVENYIKGEDSIINVPCADFDTTKDSVRIYVKDSVLKYIKVNKVLTKIVRDLKYELQLKSDIKKRDEEINKLKSKTLDLSSDVNKFSKRSFRLGVALSIVIVLFFLIIFRKPILRVLVKI